MRTPWDALTEKQRQRMREDWNPYAEFQSNMATLKSLVAGTIRNMTKRITVDLDERQATALLKAGLHAAMPHGSSDLPSDEAFRTDLADAVMHLTDALTHPLNRAATPPPA